MIVREGKGRERKEREGKGGKGKGKLPLRDIYGAISTSDLCHSLLVQSVLHP